MSMFRIQRRSCRQRQQQQRRRTNDDDDRNDDDSICCGRSCCQYRRSSPCSPPALLFLVSVLLLLSTATFTTTTLPVAVAAYYAVPPPQRLQNLLLENAIDNVNVEHDTGPILMPCCYDGLTARLVARAGFRATFMTGFGVSASNGYPDTQLVSYAEMLAAANTVSEALSNAALEIEHSGDEAGDEYTKTDRGPIPCIADGDTGYGNAVNVKRTVFGYGRAGMAGVMIEDQVAPKRCGHVAGKSVVDFKEAVQRVKAACDARDEYSDQFGDGTGPLVMARTDALKTDGFEAAIERCLAFREAGCDMTFLEAPETEEQMREYCSRVSGPKLANMLEYGTTPILPPAQLKKMGYAMAAYPLTLLSSSIKVMEESLRRIASGQPTDDIILSFDETKDAVGFTRYAVEQDKYKVD